jgi:nucleoside-diphosphate-sugar epimerase
MAAAGKTAFVTGGTGFVGINLIHELLAEGWQVTALHRRTSNLKYLEPLAVTRVEGDITDPRSLARALPRGVDAVFHVAGDLNVWSRRNARQTAVNVDGTHNMVDAALHAGAKRFILTSTVSAYGPQSGPITEETPSTAPSSWINYERTKWAAEEAVRAGVARGLDGVIINPCAIIGPYDRSGWAQLFFLIRDGKLKALPPGGVTFNYVGEVAKAHVAAFEHGRRGENYLLGGEFAPFAELIRLMAAQLGVALEAKVAPAAMMKLIGRVMGLLAWVTGKPPEISPEMATMMCSTVRCEGARAARELGYRAVPLERCVKESYAWLRAEGLL